MKRRDIFDGKIDKDQKSPILAGLVALGLCVALAVFVAVLAITSKNQEKIAIVVTSILMLGFVIWLITYILLTFYVLRTYPRHKKLAHLMWRDYVFSNNVFVQIDEIRYSKKHSVDDWDRIFDLLSNYIISCVSSKEIKKYLANNRYSISIMQYATIADNYCQYNLYFILKCLKDFTTDPYERELLSMAIKDYSKHNHLLQKTYDYYQQNDPRDKKPDYPFCEFINLPKVFNKGDLATCSVGEYSIVVVGDTINFDDDSGNMGYEFCDIAYLAYPLDTTYPITEENLVLIHMHAHYCDLAKISPLTKLTAQQEENYKKILQLIAPTNPL